MFFNCKFNKILFNLQLPLYKKNSLKAILLHFQRVSDYLHSISSTARCEGKSHLRLILMARLKVDSLVFMVE